MKIVTYVVLLSLVFFLTGCATMKSTANEKSLTAEVEKLKKENTTLATQRDAYKSDVERLAKEAGQVKTQLVTLQDSLSQEKQKTAELESKVEILSSELQSMEVTAIPETPKVAPDDFTKKVQLALYAAGFDPGKIDGKMGPQTIQAVKNFQEANGIKADGVAGKETWDKLQGYLEMK